MGIPANIVIMWSGAIADIPSGWFLCNGQNGTPNLTNRFVVGSGNLYTLDTTGGTKDRIVVSHNHSATTSSSGNHTHTMTGWGLVGSSAGFGVRPDNNIGSVGSTASGSHGHSASISAAGSSGTDKNMPPYYALAYIMYGGE